MASYRDTLFAEVNTTEVFEYTTQDPYLLINNLQPETMYTCRIAAVTVAEGPLSEPMTIILNTDTGMPK